MTDRSRAVYRIAWLLPLAGLAVLAGMTVWFVARALGYPYQLLHGEGVMLEFSRRLMAGEAIYKPLTQYPLGTCNYAPLPLLLARLTFPIVGFGFAAGRIWAALATLAIAAILFAWVRRAGGQLLPAAVAALAWLGLPYVYHWAPQFRVDLPGLAFSLGGVYLVWRLVASERASAGMGQDGQTGRRSGAILLGAALLFVLGLYCKQSFLAAPAAAFLYLLARSRLRALILAGGIALLGGVPFAVLVATTHGEFWNSLVSANVNPFSLSLLLSQIVDLVRIYAPLLLLAGAYIVLGRQHRAEQAAERPDGLIVIYIVLALLTVGLAGKVGSWENYFLEPLAALCLGAGPGLARLANRPLLRWAAPVVVLALVVLMWHTPRLAARVMREDAAANRVLIPQIAAAPGLVQSEDMGLLILAGKPVPYYDFQLSQLALAGRWDQSWEVNQLRQGAFSLVIFEGETRIEVEKYGRYTRTFVSALDYGYRRAEQVGKYRIYRPGPLDRDRRVAIGDSLSLVGYTLPPAQIEPGSQVSLDIVWQATRPMTTSFTSFVHLVDAGGQRVTGDDRQPWQGLYPTTRWAEGEMVRMSYTLTLPAQLPSGLYRVQAGWYDAALNRLRTPAGADSIPLAVVQAPSSQPPPRPRLKPINAEFTGPLLAGSWLTLEPGRLQVQLAWHPTGFLDSDYTVFVHLRNAAGESVAQGDGQPGGGAWPTSAWRPDVTIEDLHTIDLPADLPVGTYKMVVGLYDPATGKRLPLAGGEDEIALIEIKLP